MKLEGIHHITAITGRRPAERRLLRRRAGPAAGEEDGQPGRPDRLPPVLRRREGRRRLRPHLLRVPRRPARPRGDGMVHTDRAGGWRRPRRSTSGQSGSRSTAPRPSATDGRPALRRPRGPRPRAARSSDVSDEPLIADHPEVPKEMALQGFDGRAPTRATPRRSRPLLEEALGFEHPGEAGRLGGARREPRRPLGLRRAAGRARPPGRRHASTTSPGPRRSRSTRPGASG